jgi:hypothetical protein
VLGLLAIAKIFQTNKKETNPQPVLRVGLQLEAQMSVEPGIPGSMAYPLMISSPSSSLRRCFCNSVIDG